MNASPLELSSTSSTRVRWPDLLAVFVVTAAAFAAVIRSPFGPLDDPIMITTNPKMIEPSLAHFVSFWTESAFHIYMPLAQSIWQVLVLLFHTGTPNEPGYGISPVPFKIVSVTCHAIAAVAAAWSLSRITRTRWPAVVGALLFAVHPVQVESVAWTTGLKDVLCGMFTVLAIGLYAKTVERDRPTPWADGWWWLTLAAVVLAMLGKPTAMVLPLALLATDWAISDPDKTARPPVRRITSILPMLVPAIVCGLIIISVQNGSRVDRPALWQRPLVALDSYAFYLKQVVWPGPLAIDYGRRPFVVLGNGMAYWTWVVPAAVLIFVLSMRSRRWLLALLLFVLPIAPVSGITAFDMQQFSTVTDHYAYQSMFGVGLAAALLVRRWPTAAGLPIVLGLLLLAAQTRQRSIAWQDSDLIYRRNLNDVSTSVLSRNMLSSLSAYYGDFYTARRLTEEVRRLRPDDGGSLDSLSTIHLLMGRYRKAADAGVEAIRYANTEQLALARRVTLLGAKIADPDVSVAGLRLWIKAEPDNPYPRRMLQMVQAVKAEQAATRPTNLRTNVPIVPTERH